MGDLQLCRVLQSCTCTCADDSVCIGFALQLTYTGDIWGFKTSITVWVNPSDPSKSDAIAVFSNVNPVIPFGPDGSCSVASLQNSSRVDLQPSACGSEDGADLTSYITASLAKIWGISGSYSSS